MVAKEVLAGNSSSTNSSCSSSCSSSASLSLTSVRMLFLSSSLPAAAPTCRCCVISLPPCWRMSSLWHFDKALEARLLLNSRPVTIPRKAKRRSAWYEIVVERGWIIRRQHHHAKISRMVSGKGLYGASGIQGNSRDYFIVIVQSQKCENTALLWDCFTSNDISSLKRAIERVREWINSNN